MTYPKRANFFKKLFKKRDNLVHESKTKEMHHAEHLLLDYFISFVQNHPDLILMFSLDGEIVSHNQQYLNSLLGYRPRHKISYKEILSTDHYDQLVKAFNHAKYGKSKRVSFDILNKHGEQLYMIGTFIPIGVPSKQIEAVSLILNDITVKKKLERKNISKKNHLEQAQEIVNMGSWEYHIIDEHINCSDSCYQMTGLSPSTDLSIATIFSLVHLEDREQLSHLLKNAISKGTSFSTEFRINHLQTNEERYLKIKVNVQLEANVPTKLTGVIKDFTEQRRLELTLRETKNRYRYIFDHLRAGIWMRDEDNETLTFASKGLSELLQIPLKTLYSKTNFWDDLILPKYRPAFEEKQRLLNKGEYVERQYRIKTGDGIVKWIHEQTIPRINETGKITHLFGMVVDISYEIEMQKKLEFLAENDPVTALPNYHQLNEVLDQSIDDESIENFTLFYIDLDNFHWIVDYLGYQIGDLVLKRMANRLIDLCPENGFLAKEKDDTFILLLTNFQCKESVHRMADKVIQAVGKSVKIEPYEFHVTASMGISFYPDNGDQKLVLLENAHAALYHAKNLGKNNYQVYSFDRDISSHKKYSLEKDLRQAIENEEFEICYQPQVNSQTNAIIGAEALIRWHHQDWGVVSPSEFIPIAEEKHLIHEIGDWVIHSVCQQLQIWREQGHDICPVSINISPIRFLKPGIVDIVKDALIRYEIPAKYIQLEVTESSLLQNNEHIIKTLHALKELGVKIALDDFGTGYSTFQYLQTFDIDVLKIDKSFIQKIFCEDKSETKEAAIVSSFIHLAQGLDMEVVAEGVEEYEQLEFLSQKQCDIVQGYIYSKPVPVDEFERLVQKRYLRPQKRRRIIKPEEERRKYYRFAFPFHLPAKMYITEVNQRKVNIGYATILAENLSLGGIRFLSTFRLPVVSNMKLKFEFELMKEHFNLAGSLVYRNEEKADIFSYGVSFRMTEGERDKLAEIVNRMAILRRLNQEIPNTHFIEEDPYLYLRKYLM